jgi:hypothetical protein
MTLRPPSGAPPPERAEIDGHRFDLREIAADITRRYFDEFPDEAQRYGPAAEDWCRHDNQWVLRWAIDDAAGHDGHLVRQVSWLARVLGAREFPLERLARSLQIAAETVEPDRLGSLSAAVAQRLRAASETVDDLARGSTAPAS